MDYKAVIFDFDYTLGDATEAILAGFTYGMTSMGYPAPERETVRQTVGMLLEDAYTKLTGDTDPEHRDQFRTLFSSVARPMQAANTPLCTGASELLHGLRNVGAATGIVSTKHTTTLNTILAQHRLNGLLSFVIGGDMVESPKPDPEGLRTGIRLLGLTSNQILYCGDTVIDAETARNASVNFCAVLNGTTPAEAFSPYSCRHIAPNLPDLQRWLNL